MENILNKISFSIYNKHVFFTKNPSKLIGTSNKNIEIELLKNQ